ncbi:hypothetical protein [Streptomyces cylindrosporus]|uniref:Uncharacterized protein n=1 Tax=Streptomyces cylindrosporus TaxID=2927583 RepID=A0ABS9Y2J1_9ACTN|nr:hypothetical protein [Streptomyces cylindrosporus]MCI3271432.1 hypothetical protein [Streptomyces cylindrosporus]
MFVRRSTYRALQARYEAEVKGTAELSCSIVRLTTEVDGLRKELEAKDPGPIAMGRREADLHHRLGLAQQAHRALDEQLRPLQAANEAMAAELRALREGSEARA